MVSKTKKESLPYESFQFLVHILQMGLNMVGVNIFVPSYKKNPVLYLMFAICGTYFMLVFYTINLTIREDWKKSLETLCVAGMVIQALAKLVTYVTYCKEYLSTMLQLKDIYRDFSNTETYRNILAKYIKKYKMAIILNNSIYFTAMLSMWIAPIYYYIFEERKVLPINILLPGIDKDTESGYFTLYVIHSGCIFLGGMGNNVSDIVFVIYTLSMCLLSDILRQKINDFNEMLKNNAGDHRIELKALVDWLETCSAFNQLTTKNFFLIVVTEIACSAFGAIISIFIGMTSDWPLAISTTLANLVCVYTYCVVGSLWENSADEVIEMIYDIEWYRLNVKHQKVILFMLLRSQKKVLFTIGGISPLSVNTALQITKTIYSFWMMLKIMLDKN